MVGTGVWVLKEGAGVGADPAAAEPNANPPPEAGGCAGAADVVVGVAVLAVEPS